MPEEPFWTERRVRAALEWYREMSAVIAEGFDTRLIGADDFDAQMSIRFLGELGRIRREDPGGCRRPRGEARAPAVYALAEAKADLDRAIVALPGRLRRVVIRHYRDGLMTHEIAQEIHASPSTVRTHLERARKKILLFLEPLVDATP